MKSRFVKKTLVTIFVLLGVFAVASLFFVHSPKGQVITKQLQNKYRTGELEQALRLYARRTIPKRSQDLIPKTLEADRTDLPDMKIIPALSIDELTPTLINEFSNIETNGWSHSFGNSTSSKHANIPWLNADKATKLKQTWIYETPDKVANIQATPIFTGEYLIFPDARHRIVALKPETGDLVWEFDPEIPQPARRGLVFAPNPNTTSGNGIIYFTANGRVFALDALTGFPYQNFGKQGSIVLGYPARVAPQLAGDTLYIASLMPAIHAVDRHTGARKWTLDLLSGKLTNSIIGRLIAQPVEFSGANPWGGMAMDVNRGLIFLSLSNPVPVAYGVGRPGNNSPANSVIAIDTTTGEIRWRFQEIMHDLWDLDIAAPPTLARINRDDRYWDVVAVPTKAGNLLLLDRLSGRPIFDWHLRRAPISVVPGERTAAYQPDPDMPRPFGKMAFTLDDVTNIGIENRNSVLEQLQNAQFGFFEPHVPDRQTIFYGLHGGAMHMGAALDPQRAVLFVAASHVPSSFTITQGTRLPADDITSLSGKGSVVYAKKCAYCHGNLLQGDNGPPLSALDPAYSRMRFRKILIEGLRAMPGIEDLEAEDVESLYRMLVIGEGILHSSDGKGPDKAVNPGGAYRRTAYMKLKDNEGYPGSQPPWGTLTAINLTSGKHIWRVPLGRHDELMERGIAQTGTENMSGPAVTSGGALFVSGTKDRLIRAFDAQTGTEVWEAELPFIGSASPMLFEHDNSAYVVVPATGGGTLGIYDSKVETGSAFVAFRVDR